MRHLLVVVAVICAVIGDGWAQNRGSARYVPPEDFDGDVTRAPRPSPTRGAAVRRQRPTKAPESAAVEDELKDYQPPESRVRTTARRVPQRGSPQQVAPPPPLPLLVEDPASRYPAPVEDLPQVPPTGPEGRPQGTRRRRPKKRRRPQTAVPKVVEEPEKQLLTVPEEEKSAISELLNEDKKRTGEFQNNPQSRHAPPSYGSEPSYQPEKTAWENNSPAEDQRNTAEPQYFRPQPPTNRLPVEDADPIGNSRRYIESSPVVPDVDSPAPYVPKRPSSSVSNEGSYIPILPPIRVPSEGASRLPPENYPTIRNKESTRPVLPSSDPNVPLRGHGNRSPVADPDEIIRNTDAKPAHNIIPQPDEPVVPTRSHSVVRLPQDEQPLLSPEYDPSNFDSADDLIAPNAKTSEDGEEPPNTSNRLPNPSEIHYDSVYPEFSERPSRGPQRAAVRRQESAEPAARNPLPSYSSPRRDTGTKPQEYDNDAEVDRRQASQYRPPLQRTSSRYKPEDLEGSPRSRTQEYPPSTTVPRTRGSSRYQSPTDEFVPERTRSATRSHSEPPADGPSRTRSSTTSQSTTRTRGTQRYPSDIAESDASRSSSRRQPVNTEPVQRNTPPAGYVPVDDIIQNPQRSHLHRPRNQDNLYLDITTEGEPEDVDPVRNTLRSRPQYEVRDAEPAHNYEESVEDTDVYSPDYQPPRQTSTRGRTNERTSAPRQPPPPEYQVPQNRQQNRQESHYEQPQNPRSRHQPQYQAPQNPRSDSRQTSRQNPPNTRQQGRPRNQSPEPSAPPSRSTGGSNFVCPDSFGFFADPVQCDKYYECRNGTAEMSLCSDGLAFNEMSAPKFLRCDSLRDVDCKSRPELQKAQPTKNCPRRFGLFPHETDCTKFWNCVDGAATEVQCPPGLTYNNEKATCDWADLVETSCKTEDLLGFTCPEPTAFDLQDGVYSRYPHPKDCQLHFTCIKGADGLRRPRMLSCNEGTVFDSATGTCARPEDVPGCEDFYGGRSQAPKRKPARQPAPREPEPEEEILEEPTPRPRRRGSNRRTRN